MVQKFLTFAILILITMKPLGAQPYVRSGDHHLIDSTMGDLDGDSVAEKVLVYNTVDHSEYGVIRELHILKRKAGKWVLWQSSRSAVRPSEDGGMMRDPYGGIYIYRKVFY